LGDPRELNLKRPLLILDLDETLISASEEPPSGHHDFLCGPYFIRKRPFAGSFLAAVALSYDLAAWTSATEAYARCVAEHLFDRVSLAFLWARPRCTLRRDPCGPEEYFVKDLKKVRRAGYDLRRVLVVDDSLRALERHRGNLVQVRPFTGDPGDQELEHLAAYLIRIAGSDDFRRVEKRAWRAAAID